jgi:phospholipid transport system substrate-binding protein
MPRFRRCLVAFTALAVLLVGRDAAEGSPTAQLRATVDRVIQTLQGPALADDSKAVERRQAVRAVAEEIFDLGETARRALGRHWRDRTEAEQREFVALFSDVLERTYVSQIARYGGERVVYAGEVQEDDFAVVKTRIVLPRSGETVPVDYRMRRRGDRWLVYDVAIEGVSLVANYRSQFNRIIATSSYEHLVSRMQSAHQVRE